MSIAAPAQKLLRIVFRSYMCFPGSEIQKKCFDGDRCVSRSDEIVIYRETKKMSIAAIKRKLLRIFFWIFGHFPGSKRQKSIFYRMAEKSEV